MPSKHYTPILIGVADIKNASKKVEDAIEPLQLMVNATKLALQDTSLPASSLSTLQANIDSVSVVAPWTWNYHDLPGLVANGLDVVVKEEGKVLSHHGGDSPAKLVDEAARRVARGESKVGVVCGGEAIASLIACATAGKMPPPNWTPEDESQPSIVSLGKGPSGAANVGSLHGIGLPIHIYPLYENALRHHRQQSLTENHAESAEIYAQFAKIAAEHPYAWNHGKPAKSAQEIASVGRDNRMICFPYPLLMNAFNNVNLAAACILTSTEYAMELGIPQSKWIYPLGGAGTADSSDFWKRPNYHSSPALSASLDAALSVSNLKPSDIDIYDFYSCFPIVPKLASLHLGLNPTQSVKPITVLGGLTSFGGAGNNYSMHAITEITRQLRHSSATTSRKKNALVLANGGVLTYQHAICLSSTAPSSPYPVANPLHDTQPASPVPMAEIAPGAVVRAVVETYTVSYGRDGEAEGGWVVGRVDGAEGGRFVAVVEEGGCLREMVGREAVGRWGWVRREDGGEGRNAFAFGEEARL